MDAFSYLSVLLSVILGLAITQVLQGYRAIALNRRSVRLFWPTLVWTVLLLAMIAQHWWSSFSLAEHRGWTFPAFAAVLTTAGLIYMMTALVLPDIGRDEAVDLEAHYWREVAPFFGVGAATIAASVAREMMLEGRLPEATNLAFHALFIAMSLTLIAVRRPWLHKAFAAGMAGLFVAYIALLFVRLG